MGELLTTAVERQKAERDAFMARETVPREGVSRVRDTLRHQLIKVIIGPRRAGKSVFCFQTLRGRDFGYLNFDDEALNGLSDYDDLLKAVRRVYGETRTLLLDEIQNLDKWELFVNRIQRRGFNLLLTGSNSRLLSRDLATHLTGRYLQFKVLPFSFSEFLTTRGSPADAGMRDKERQGTILALLAEYLENGGFPEVVVNRVDARAYLSTLYEGILFRDVVKRHRVRDPKKLYDLGLFLLTNHSAEFSYNRLKTLLDFRSVHTAATYAEYLNEAFLLFFVPRFSRKTREQIKSPRKVYGYDTGLVNAVKFRISPDRGRLMENAVAAQLLRGKSELYSYRTADGREVDFAVKQGLAVRQLIQVCYRLEGDKTRERELDALLKASEETGCRHLLVVTWDEEGRETIKGRVVEYLPFPRWSIETQSENA